MRLFALFFMLGTLIIQMLLHLPSVIWIGLFLSVSIFLSIFLYRNARFNTILLISNAVFLGLLLSTIVAQNQLTKRLPTYLEGKNIVLVGKVLGIPNDKDDGVRFRFKIDKAYLQAEPEKLLALKGIVRLGWFQNKQRINADEQWRLLVRMKRPSGFLNPGGFDYEKWLFTERITATGYIRNSPNENKRLEDSPSWSVNRLRQTIHQNIQKGVEDKASAAVLSALVVAVRTRLDDKQWKLLQQTGTSHLVAISGLHIAVVAGFAFLPIMLIWGAFPRLNEKIPLRVAGAVTGVIFATIYAFLAGFTLPTQRALLMVTIALLGLLLRRNYHASTIMAVALVAVLLLDPLAGMTISFWLSFLAVVLILIILKRQMEKPFLQMIKLQIVLSLGMLPLTLFFFGTASLTSPLANLLAIPWVSLVIVPLSLIALVLMPISSFVSNAVFSISALAIDWLFRGFELIGGLKVTELTFAQIPSLYLVVAFIGFLYLLLPKGFPARWLGFVALLPAILFSVDKPQQGQFTFTLLDVGQGMASVVQTANHTLVYDTGTRYSESYDIGKLVVVPFLRAKGVEVLDSLVISHDDIDHRGGTGVILNNLVVKEIISSEENILHNQNSSSRTITACVKNNHWTWDGVTFKVLSPPSNYLENDNNRSCVIRVSNQHHSLLLTGDIQRKTEKLLLKQAISEVIIVPHHGSKTSSTSAFIKAVSPALALVPVGYRNRFGHPKEQVLARYKENGVQVLNTVDSGAITLKFPVDESKYIVEEYRKKRKGFWSR